MHYSSPGLLLRRPGPTDAGVCCPAVQTAFKCLLPIRQSQDVSYTSPMALSSALSGSGTSEASQCIFFGFIWIRRDRELGREVFAAKYPQQIAQAA